MLWINLKRIIRSGFVSFWRNGFVSLSAILVMVITLFVIGTVIFSNALLKGSLEVVKNKVDINVYMQIDTPEEDILALQSELQDLPEVDVVEYVSRDQALANFIDRNKDDEATLLALDELEDNPLGAILNVKAKEPSQYGGVALFLDDTYNAGAEGSIIEEVNYLRNKAVIDGLSRTIDAGERLGGLLMIIFIVIAIIIALNTIRLAMFMSRDEIHVMRMVGAEQSYISGPFVVAGALYGITSAIVTLILFYPLTYFLGPITERFFAGTDIFAYYVSNFGQMFLIIFFSGILIGSVSSFLAIKRYMKRK